MLAAASFKAYLVPDLQTTFDYYIITFEDAKDTKHL